MPKTLYKNSWSAVLLDNQMRVFFHTSGHPSKVTPIACTVQHPFGEHPVRNPPQPSHLYFHSQEAHMRPVLCRWHWSAGRLQMEDFSNKLTENTNAYEIKTTTAKSKVIFNDKVDIYMNCFSFFSARVTDNFSSDFSVTCSVYARNTHWICGSKWWPHMLLTVLEHWQFLQLLKWLPIT